MNFLHIIYGHNQKCNRHFHCYITHIHVLNKTCMQQILTTSLFKSPWCKSAINLNILDIQNTQLLLNGHNNKPFYKGSGCTKGLDKQTKISLDENTTLSLSFIKLAFLNKLLKRGKNVCAQHLSRAHYQCEGCSTQNRDHW